MRRSTQGVVWCFPQENITFCQNRSDQDLPLQEYKMAFANYYCQCEEDEEDDGARIILWPNSKLFKNYTPDQLKSLFGMGGRDSNAGQSHIAADFEYQSRFKHGSQGTDSNDANINEQRAKKKRKRTFLDWLLEVLHIKQDEERERLKKEKKAADMKEKHGKEKQGKEKQGKEKHQNENKESGKQEKSEA